MTVIYLKNIQTIST